MKRYLIGLIAAGAATVCCSQTKQESDMSLVHVRNTFEFIVHSPYREAAPLFGPNGERAWGEGHWDPQFLYPQPARDVEGAVFTVQHGQHKSIWVNTIFNLEAGHLQYVYFIPEALVTTIDVNLHPDDASHTKVAVTYTRTALNPDANEHVMRLGEDDKGNGKDWQDAISRYLDKRKQ